MSMSFFANRVAVEKSLQLSRTQAPIPNVLRPLSLHQRQVHGGRSAAWVKVTVSGEREVAQSSGSLAHTSGAASCPGQGLRDSRDPRKKRKGCSTEEL